MSPPGRITWTYAGPTPRAIASSRVALLLAMTVSIRRITPISPGVKKAHKRCETFALRTQIPGRLIDVALGALGQGPGVCMLGERPSRLLHNLLEPPYFRLEAVGRVENFRLGGLQRRSRDHVEVAGRIGALT